MKKYEILEHKADLKIRVFGTTKEEFFLNALLAMKDYLKPEFASSVEHQISNRKIEINSLDLPALLVDFLNEVLYLIQTNKEIYHNIKFNKFTDKEIKAELFGNKVEKFEDDIKAVTHHSLEIKQKNDGNWEAIVLFDI